ncbi:MAG: EamA family transporter [Paracoccaceae bacterium]
MSGATFALVLTAAVLHASWNAMLKVSGDKAVMLGLISLGHVVFGAIMACFVPFPAVESWPYLAASTLIHFAYYALLNYSYRLGDLSLVYPIARGIVPVLVALGAQITIGETLPFQTWIGVLIVSGGVLLLSSDALRTSASRKAVPVAITTGLVIALYSVTDGLGVRQSQAALGYIAWLFILEVFVVAFVCLLRGRQMLTIPRRTLVLGIVGGVVSATAYGLVIYAKVSAPLGVVSALRETSVLFAGLIGVLLLGERPWRKRLVAAFVVVAGILVIALN